ncbi:MAG: hypothetical protein Q4D94_13280 [Bacillota bacterium]|nr:hypothetical protein [Bacillota bacterium]
MKKRIGSFWTEKIRQWTNRRVHRQVKDRLFRFLLEKDRGTLLQLYNALNETNYTDVSQLQVVTIESVVYMVMKNDLAFVITGVLNLYEHQSTYNPNMPVRFLIYLAQEYQKVIEQAKESLYGTRQITLPTPKCIVFYNGDKEVPEEQILRLSDAFENKEHEADVELKVRMLNINYGYNTELMNKCRVLKEYVEFVEVTKTCAASSSNVKTALNQAIDYCIENDILAKFLREHRGEVLGMLLEEFDIKKYEKSVKEEGRLEGQERINCLYQRLKADGRTEDILRAIDDEEYQKRLLLEYDL